LIQNLHRNLASRTPFSIHQNVSLPVKLLAGGQQAADLAERIGIIE